MTLALTGVDYIKACRGDNCETPNHRYYVTDKETGTKLLLVDNNGDGKVDAVFKKSKKFAGYDPISPKDEEGKRFISASRDIVTAFRGNLVSELRNALNRVKGAPLLKGDTTSDSDKALRAKHAEDVTVTDYNGDNKVDQVDFRMKVEDSGYVDVMISSTLFVTDSARRLQTTFLRSGELATYLEPFDELFAK